MRLASRYTGEDGAVIEARLEVTAEAAEPASWSVAVVDPSGQSQVGFLPSHVICLLFHACEAGLLARALRPLDDVTRPHC